MKKKGFGAALQEIRNKHNMTQDELGDKLKVSRYTVIDWESGKRSPSLDNTQKLADIFHMSLADFVKYIDAPGTLGLHEDVDSNPIATIQGETIVEGNIVFKYTEKDRTAEVVFPANVDPGIMAVAIEQAAASVRGHEKEEGGGILVVKRASGGDAPG